MFEEPEPAVVRSRFLFGLGSAKAQSKSQARIGDNSVGKQKRWVGKWFGVGGVDNCDGFFESGMVKSQSKKGRKTVDNAVELCNNLFICWTAGKAQSVRSLKSSVRPTPRGA